MERDQEEKLSPLNMKHVPKFNLRMDKIGDYVEDINQIRTYRNALLLNRNLFLIKKKFEKKKSGEYIPKVFEEKAQTKMLFHLLEKNNHIKNERLYQQIIKNHSFSLKMLENKKLISLESKDFFNPSNYNQYGIIRIKEKLENNNSTEEPDLLLLVNLISLYPPGLLKKIENTENPNLFYLLPLLDGFPNGSNNIEQTLSTIIKQDWLNPDDLKEIGVNLITKVTDVSEIVSNWVKKSYTKMKNVSKGCQLSAQSYDNDFEGNIYDFLPTLKNYVKEPIAFCRKDLNIKKENKPLDAVIENNSKKLNKKSRQKKKDLVTPVENLAKMVFEPIRMNTVLFVIIMATLFSLNSNFSIKNSFYNLPKAVKWCPQMHNNLENLFYQNLRNKGYSISPLKKEMGKNFLKKMFYENMTLNIKSNNDSVNLEITNFGLSAFQIRNFYNKNETNENIEDYHRTILNNIVSSPSMLMSSFLLQQVRQMPKFSGKKTHPMYRYILVNDNTMKMEFFFDKEYVFYLMPTLSDVNDSLSMEFLKNLKAYEESLNQFNSDFIPEEPERSKKNKKPILGKKNLKNAQKPENQPVVKGTLNQPEEKNRRSLILM